MKLFLSLSCCLFLFTACNSPDDETRGKYESTVTIEVHPSPIFRDEERFTENQVTILSARALLDRAAEEIEMDPDLLARSIEVSHLKDRDLLRITAHHDDEDLPKVMIEHLLRIYTDLRKELGEEQLKVLSQTLSRQAELVEKKKREIPIRALAFPQAEDGPDELGMTDEAMLEKAKEKLTRFEKLNGEISKDLGWLKKLDEEKGLAYAATLRLPENQVAHQLKEAQRFLDLREAKISTGLAKSHPEVMLLNKKAEQARELARQEFNALRDILEIKQGLVHRQVERMKKLVEGYWAENEHLILLQQDYDLAREEHDDALRFLRKLELHKESMIAFQANPEELLTIHNWEKD